MSEKIRLYLFVVLLLTITSAQALAQDAIHFIENKNQWDEHILYRADISGGKIYVGNSSLTYLFYNSDEVDEQHHHHNLDELHFHAVEMKFLGANPNPEIIQSQPISYHYNYYLGNDKSKWASNVNGFCRIRIKDIYEGIDLEIQGEADHIKYTFFVSDIGDPDEIRIKYTGQDKIKIIKDQLRIKTSIVEIMETIPEVYQLNSDQKIPIACKFDLNNNVLGFSFPEGFDINLPIVIDPKIIFASYSGSYSDNFGYTATYDDSGYAYSAGTVFGPNFPYTLGAYQTSFKGGHASTVAGSGVARDIGILKYLPDGTGLVYATYLGGKGNEDPHSLVVDHNYNLVVFGNTSSSDFPIGNTYADDTYNDSFDIFVAKLSINGDTLLASSYHGGSSSDALNGYYILPITNKDNESNLGFNYGDSYRGEVIVDSSNNIYIITTTKSADFPYTSGAMQTTFGGGGQDACVVKFNSKINTVLASTFLGGTLDDAGYGIALNSVGDVYVCGGTESNNLPVSTGKYQTSFQGGTADGFIYHMSGDLKQKKAATYFGTNKYDQVYFVQTDLNDNVYVTGQTKSDFFPVKNVTYSEPKGKQFISKLNPGLDSLIYSTVFGTGGVYPDLSPSAFLVDYCERVYFSGWGGNTNISSRVLSTNMYRLTHTQDAFQKTTDGSDFYLIVFSRDIQSLLYATYFGGYASTDHVDGGTSRFDKNGIVYQSVCASCGGHSNDFPTFPSNVHSSTNNSTNCNNAIFKIDLDIPDLEAEFDLDTIFCLADSTSIINLTQGGRTYFWDFGIAGRTDDTSSLFQPKFQYSDTGTYLVTLYAANINSCDLHDTFSKEIYVYNQSNSDFKSKTLDCVNEFEFQGISQYGQFYSWDFGDTSSLINSSKLQTPQHVFSDTGYYNVTLYVDSGTVCQHITQKMIHVSALPKVDFDFEIDTCKGEAEFVNNSMYSAHYLWVYGDQDSSYNADSLHNHIYGSVDSYAVYLIAMPNTVCADTLIKSFKIITPAADAILEIDSCRFLVNFFNPSQYAYKASYWDFGDGSDLSFVDTVYNHAYSVADTYRIMLIANLGTLCLDTVYKTFILPELPKANFNFKHEQCSPEVNFYNQSDFAQTYNWDFGNGKTGNAVDSTLIKYDSSGKYFIQLIAISPQNCRDTLLDTLDILHLAKAKFDLHWDTCTNKVDIRNFSSKSGNYLWDYGDGNSGSDTNWFFSHQFDTVGIYLDTSRQYMVQLIVNDPPCSDTAYQQIVIHVPPKIDFLVDYDSCSPLAKFTSYSQGAKNYHWSFGDGDSSTNENIVHEYAEAGDYQVTFIINQNEICTDSIVQKISVNRYQPNEIIWPNIMTPNHDNLNDKFIIEGLNFNCDYYEVFIYNRWGQLLFYAENEDIYWDGTVDGVEVADGTYYFILKSNYIDLAGTITLLRK